MKRVAMVVALIAGLAHAEDFRSHAQIRIEGSDPFQRVELPFEAYRDARADLADVRVLNGKSEPVPLAFAGDAIVEKEAAQVVRLPQFPVTTPLAPTTAGGRLSVQVRTLPDGTLVSVQQGPAVKATSTRAMSYLLDASALKFPIGALQFDWDAKPGSEVVKVNVDASDDLRDWRSVASRVALVRLEQGGQVLAQTRVPLHSVRAKYFRLTWEGSAFDLRHVDAESATTSKIVEPRKLTRTVLGTRDKDGDLFYDLGARLPVESVRVMFPEVNSVAPFEIAARDSPKAPWRTVTSGTFYRIVRDNTELVSSPLSVGTFSAREWRLRPQVKGVIGGTLPSLEVTWRPAQVIFVAKGEGPFTLAFGDPEAKSVAILVSSLMPGYERGADRKLPLATLADISTAPLPPPPVKIFGDMEPKKVGLWAVLIVGVLVLAFMAWGLSKQMK